MRISVLTVVATVACATLATTTTATAAPCFQAGRFHANCPPGVRGFTPVPRPHFTGPRRHHVTHTRTHRTRTGPVSHGLTRTVCISQSAWAAILAENGGNGSQCWWRLGNGLHMSNAVYGARCGRVTVPAPGVYWQRRDRVRHRFG